MINIVYTNKNCKDVYDIFKNQHSKYCKLPLFVISDYDGDHIYDNNQPYYKHWIEALSKVKEDYFIYNQEDFLLYNEVNIEIIKHLEKVLVLNPEYSFIRLIKSGQNLSENPLADNLYPVNADSYPLYSMQATIWNKSRFIELYEKSKQSKWFESDIYEDNCRLLDIKGLYYYNGESRRGGHYDSSIYPYIATAVVKGKWNLGEYPSELGQLLVENNININKRGLI